MLLAWGQRAAVVSGVVHNAAVMALLLGHESEGRLHVSYLRTLLKLALMIVGPVYALLV